jgi:glycosyltransferase involved in cell wall biosynthesis
MSVLVSVVMPVFNAARYLRESMKSILNQTFTEFEFILVNDGSSDDSVNIIKSYNDKRIKLIQQENQGVAGALNTGLRMSEGKYIIRADADDLNHPMRIEKQVGFLEKNSEYILVASYVKVIDEEGEEVYCSGDISAWEEIEKSFPFPPFYHSSVAFRKDVVERVGGYNTSVSKLNAFEDLILWNKLSCMGKMYIIPEYLIDYRLTSSSSTTKIGRMAKLTRKYILSILDGGNLDEHDIRYFLEEKKKIGPRKQKFYYHKYLLKKYTLNNRYPKKARQNFREAIKIEPFDIQIWGLMLTSFLPASTIKILLKKLKKTGPGSA